MKNKKATGLGKYPIETDTYFRRYGYSLDNSCAPWYTDQSVTTWMEEEKNSTRLDIIIKYAGEYTITLKNNNLNEYYGQK